MRLAWAYLSLSKAHFFTFRSSSSGKLLVQIHFAIAFEIWERIRGNHYRRKKVSDVVFEKLHPMSDKRACQKQVH